MVNLSPNVYLRQLDIISKEKFTCPICIIGAGATGSFVALALAKMGMNKISIWDFDSVEEHNFPNQLFRLNDLMGYKAERTANIVKDFTGIDVKFENKKYENQKLQGVVVLAVDSMDTRRRIYENCQKTEDVSLIVDPRTGGETFRIYTINPHSAKDRKFYEKYLYSDNVVAPIPCTAQAIIYNVLAVSALICNQIKRYLMAQPYNIEILADTGNCMLLTK